MGLKIVCSGYLVRHPVGGLGWHHLQYLVGLQQLGHEVTFFEHYGWHNSCYDPSKQIMTSDPRYGIEYLVKLLRRYGLEHRWCYLAENGVTYGMSRARLAELCRASDLYLNLSNVNWIPELEECQCRVLIDTDPVFTQIGAHGLGGPYSRYQALFTFGENVHHPGCSMPSGGAHWLPTRQPVVLDLWPVEAGERSAPFTTVMNWSALGDQWHQGHFYGQKDSSFEPFLSLPRDTGAPMEIAMRPPAAVRPRLAEAGWRIVDPFEVIPDLWTYQSYLQASRAEFSVAKHGYVITRCGWFSERSAAYLASGRPVLVQDTGFGDWLETGMGVIPFSTLREAQEGVAAVCGLYGAHCCAAREIAEEYFDARRVLSDLVERAMAANTQAPSKLSKGPSEADGSGRLH